METENITTEQSPLLSKVPASSLTEYSQRTVATVDTSSSYEQLDQRSTPLAKKSSDEEESGDLTGSVVVVEIARSDQEAPNRTKAQDDDEPVDGTFAENVHEQCQEVVDVVLAELYDADQGEMHYLEMGLTRNCSVIPSDVIDAASQQALPPTPPSSDETDVEAATEPQKEKPAPAPPISAYLVLLTAVISLSSIGPFLKLQSGVSPTMKIVWRQAATGLLLLPMVIIDFSRSGFPSLTGPQWFTFLLSTISYDIFTTSFDLALGYTSVGNVVILANSLALILLIGKLFVGDPVSLMEGSGAIVAFAGAALCSKDSEGSEGSSNGILGDAIAILSAIGGVGYLVFAKTSRQHMPMYTFMFLTMAVGSAMLVTFQALILKEEVSFDRHPNHGVWGFLVMEADRLPLEFVMAFVCNCCGTMG